MKNLLAIALFAPFHLLYAQVNTFNKTYRDTLVLSNISSRPVELPDGVYSIASAGGGLSLSQGSYQRIYQVNQQGELIQNRMEYDLNRTYSGFSKLIRSNDENLFLASTRSKLGNTPGNRIIVQKISADLSDTLWSYLNSDSSSYNTTADIFESTNGDVYITARRRPLENDSMLGIFIRLDSQGQFVSEMIIREREVQALESLVQLADGSELIGGTRGPANSTNLRGFLMKISVEGQILWSQDYPQITECGMSLYGENKVILSGYIAGSYKPKILMLDIDGNLIFNKTYSNTPTGTSNYIGRRVSDGGIVSVGITDIPENDAVDDGFVMKTDSLGNLLWVKVYTIAQSDYFTDFIETSDGGLLISGSASQSNADGGQNSWLIKLDADGCLDPANCGVGIEDAPFPDAVTIYPNPATDWLLIDLETAGSAYTAQLLDATGRVVQQEQFTVVGTHTLSLSGLATGIYYCRVLKGDEVVVVEKVVKVN